MAQWDIYAAVGGVLVLNVQSELVRGVDTRLVVPLVPEDALPPVDPRLIPAVLAGDLKLYATVLSLTALPRAALGPVIANAESARDEVTRALDIVLAGV